MAETDELTEDAPLTADEILTFGPVVEAQVWTPIWLQERRAPIAVAAGKPKLGKVFDDHGVGEAIVIRPCMSRGRRVRGLPPVYTPNMLEKHAGVFDGWPMFTDHVPPELAVTMAKHGRSVKELGGQLLKGRWRNDFVHEEDATYGYRPGAVQASIWATPLIRRTVGENPNLLHTSINAWPTSGKPGPVPWRPAVKGMLIEGIRRQPQGSVDYVVRGGAGGRLLLIEGVDDEPAWPEIGEWDEDDRRFVVSLAESFYASRQMTDLTLPSKPDELGAWIQEHAPHLAPALAESAGGEGGTRTVSTETVVEGITEERVREMLAEASSEQPTVDEFEQRLAERVDEQLREARQAETLSARALELIKDADGVLESWKGDLRSLYSLSRDSVPAKLVIQESDLTGDDGATLTPTQVIESRVQADLQHTRDLIAEAQGKPRVRGEGGSGSRESDRSTSGSRREKTPYWRTAMAGMGVVESESAALDMFGEKVES